MNAQTAVDEKESASSDNTIMVSKRSKNPQSDGLIGKTLKGRYCLESKIGSGGMSDVYRGKDLVLADKNIPDAHVAIKVLQPEFASNAEINELLLHEAQKTRQLSHPNIVKIFDVDIDRGIHFIVMEWMDGEPLDRVIKRSTPKGLQFKSAINIIEQISQALTYAHQSGIVHTDLKPANIMLTRTGEIKIFDFGVARKLPKDVDAYAANLTPTEILAGGYTPAYASPELLANHPPAIRDDIFSFACIIYEMLTSKHPFGRIPANRAQEENRQVKKPKSIGFLTWRSFRKALAYNAPERPESVNTAIRPLTRNRFPLLAKVSAFLLLLALGAGYTIDQQAKIDYHTQLQLIDYQYDNTIEHLQLSSPENFLQALRDEKDQYQLRNNPLRKLGLIRHHRNSLLAFFSQQVSHVLEEDDSYPNFPHLESIMAEGLALYPDSQFLTGLAQDINHKKQSDISAIEMALNKRLSEGLYARTGNGNDIYQMIDDLNDINPKHNANINPEAINQYRDRFDQAILKNDIPTLAVMIEAGTHVFSHLGEIQDLMAVGKELRSAVTVLTNYEKEIANGQEIEFPVTSAIKIYQNSFAAFGSRLNKEKSLSKIDLLYSDVEALAKDLPLDFPLLVDMRKKLATRYLSLADELLEQNQNKTARRVMQKANILFSKSNV